MKTYNEAKIEFLNHYAFQIDSNEPLTFGSVYETDKGWRFNIVHIPELISGCKYPSYDPMLPAYILKDDNDTEFNRYDMDYLKGKAVTFSPDVRGKGDCPLNFFIRKISCIKSHIHRICSTLKYENHCLIYRFLGVKKIVINKEEIEYVGSLMFYKKKSLWRDWLMVIIKKDKQVVFIPIQSAGFIESWRSFKIVEEGMMRLKIYNFNDTESSLCYPFCKLYEPIFKTIKLKRSVIGFFLKYLGYYKFDYELNDNF